MQKELRDSGLTENESKVYLTLLELGPSNAGLIARRSGLHRRVTYDVTDRLIKKGLIGYIIKNGKRLFQASDPERIMEILKEKEEVLLDVLPNLKSLYKNTQEKEETNFYKGKRGLKTVFEDQINQGKEILVIGASPLAYEILQFYFKWYDKRRVKKKIKSRIIFNQANRKLKISNSEIRYLPHKYSSPLAVNIYGDKVALILWSKDNPFAIVVRNREVSNGYRKYFDLMWHTARKE